MLKVTETSKTQSIKPSETKNTAVVPNKTSIEIKDKGQESDAYSAKKIVSEELKIEQSLLLALPTRASFNPAHEEQLSYFIGSNVLDAHVQMYAEINTDHTIVATLFRDEKNIIQTHYEHRSPQSSWYFSKESLAEIIKRAKVELERFPDTVIEEDE